MALHGSKTQRDNGAVYRITIQYSSVLEVNGPVAAAGRCVCSCGVPAQNVMCLALTLIGKGETLAT
ncbi:hypothetical protein PG995_015944 [Apiospora arundinis]